MNYFWNSWNRFCFFYNFITCNNWISNNASYISTIFATTCGRILNITFLIYAILFRICTLTSTFIIISLLIELHFLLWNLHSHLNDICFINVFNLFISGFMLEMFRFKSSVLYGTHTLLERSSKVLQFPSHLFRLTAKG